MSLRKKLLTTVVLCGLLLLIFHAPVLTSLANFLLTDDPLSKADIVIALSGDTTGGRVVEAVEVMREGYADKLIVIGGLLQWETYECDIMKKHAVHLGIPEDAVIAVRMGKSTYAQAAKIAETMRERGFKSAILVTSDFHARRARYVLRKVFLPLGLTFTVHSSPDIGAYSESWWKNTGHAEVILDEYIKLLWYWLKY